VNLKIPGVKIKEFLQDNVYSKRNHPYKTRTKDPCIIVITVIYSFSNFNASFTMEDHSKQKQSWHSAI